MKRFVLLPLAAVAAATLALTGCSASGGGSSGGGTAAGGDTINLGVVLSQTGPFSSIGLPEVQGAKAATEQINASGGVQGKKINLIVEDAKSTPQGAAAAATKLIQNDKVVGLVGPEATALALAVAPIAHERKVPMVSGSASFLQALPAQYLDYSFASAASTAKGFAPLAAYWKGTGLTKVAIIGPKGDVFDGVVAAIKNIPSLTLTGTEQFQPGQADITANVAKIAATGPQAIIVAGATADAATAQRAWKALNVDAQIVQIGSQANEAFIKLAGPESFTERSLFIGFPTTVSSTLPADHPSKKAATEYVELMKRADPNFDPGSIAVLAWNGVMAYRDAITAAGSTDAAALRDALERTEMTNPLGVWTRTPTDHDGSTNPYIVATHDASGWKYLGGGQGSP
ncbi:MAG: ABC transporter substrate-binding protein [Pseudonocardia sp.]|uniref:ABC transporter substrate-binding protein n=1 Tax=unclassified Pseudonocardia TaxID=2619320 RepID=UPI00086B725E|nr:MULTISPECIES: ABC transporter substrate-binding protein [unclassified Pseudonocardia]MBN9110478.1 ABC transporter substrate-binding protein [Pseudonocardia sp.]ODV03443.1 MAG: hypothetical protein ABT15_22680 [Pseudonocardia sp. SCN 73-27]